MAEQIISKRCCTCKEIKPVSDFYKNRSTEDGFSSLCKICSKAAIVKYRQTVKGKKVRKEAKERYYRTDKGRKTDRRGSLKYSRTKKGRQRALRSAHTKKLRYPERVKANEAVNNAIKAGKLPRPDSLLCRYCPKPAQQYHHHKGYALEHWLDVVPACRKCHFKLRDKTV